MLTFSISREIFIIVSYAFWNFLRQTVKKKNSLVSELEITSAEKQTNDIYFLIWFKKECMMKSIFWCKVIVTKKENSIIEMEKCDFFLLYKLNF